jgi:hypothetical protein
MNDKKIYIGIIVGLLALFISGFSYAYIRGVEHGSRQAGEYRVELDRERETVAAVRTGLADIRAELEADADGLRGIAKKLRTIAAEVEDLERCVNNSGDNDRSINPPIIVPEVEMIEDRLE